MDVASIVLLCIFGLAAVPMWIVALLILLNKDEIGALFDDEWPYD